MCGGGGGGVEVGCLINPLNGRWLEDVPVMNLRYFQDEVFLQHIYPINFHYSRIHPTLQQIHGHSTLELCL